MVVSHGLVALAVLVGSFVFTLHSLSKRDTVIPPAAPQSLHDIDRTLKGNKQSPPMVRKKEPRLTPWNQWQIG